MEANNLKKKEAYLFFAYFYTLHAAIFIACMSFLSTKLSQSKENSPFFITIKNVLSIENTFKSLSKVVTNFEFFAGKASPHTIIGIQEQHCLHRYILVFQYSSYRISATTWTIILLFRFNFHKRRLHCLFIKPKPKNKLSSEILQNFCQL